METRNTGTASLYFRRLGQEAARELKLGADDFARLSAILDARSAGRPNSNVIQFSNKNQTTTIRTKEIADAVIAQNIRCETKGDAAKIIPFDRVKLI